MLGKGSRRFSRAPGPAILLTVPRRPGRRKTPPLHRTTFAHVGMRQGHIKQRERRRGSIDTHWTSHTMALPRSHWTSTAACGCAATAHNSTPKTSRFQATPDKAPTPAAWRRPSGSTPGPHRVAAQPRTRAIRTRRCASRSRRRRRCRGRANATVWRDASIGDAYRAKPPCCGGRTACWISPTRRSSASRSVSGGGPWTRAGRRGAAF